MNKPDHVVCCICGSRKAEQFWIEDTVDKKWYCFDCFEDNAEEIDKKKMGS